MTGYLDRAIAPLVGAAVIDALSAITLALLEARTAGDVVNAVAERLLPALGASGGGLTLHDQQEDGAVTLVGEELSLTTPYEPGSRATVARKERVADVRLHVPLWADHKPLGHIDALFPLGSDTTDAEALLQCVVAHCAAAVRRVRDTDRMAADLARHTASEARLSAVLDALPLGLWLTDTNGAILIDNPAGQQIWGRRYQGRDHVGAARAWWAESGEPVAPDDWSLARALRTGEPVLNEIIEIEAGDGARRSIRSSALPVRGETGRIEGVVVLNEDISALRAAQAAHEASEERLRLAAQVTGFGAYDDRGDGNVYWSPELKAIFGLPADAEIESGSEAALARIHPDDRDRWQGALTAARDPNGTGELEIEHRILRPDGTTAWVVQKGRILFEGDGPARRAVRAVGLALDITERKRAEERRQFLSDLSEMIRRHDDPNQLLSEVTRAIGSFLGVARCLFDEVDFDADREVVRDDYQDGVPSVVGEHRLSDYSPITTREMLAGRTVVNNDAKVDPRTAALWDKTYGPTGERAYIAVPLLREGVWVATLWVSVATPRAWTADEIALLETVAERTWLAVERARAKRSLRESEERFAKAFAASPHLISISMLADGRYLDVNEAVLRSTGYTREEMIGRTSAELDIFPYPEGRDRLVQALQEGGGSVRNLQLDLRGKDGALQTVLLSAEIVTIGGERCILTTSNDITERKQVEDALEETANRLRLATDAMRGFVYDYDMLTGQVWRSEGMAQVVGYQPDEAAGDVGWWSSLAHPDEAAERQQAVDALATADTYSREYRVRHRNGHYIWVWDQATIHRDAAGRPVRMLGTTVDITQRKQAEEALRSSEERLARVVENIAEGVVTIAPDGRFTSINAAGEQILGVTRDQFIGVDNTRPPFRRLTLDGEPRVDDPSIQKIAASGDSVFRHAYIIERADGTRVAIERNITAIRGGNGVFLGAVATFSDITTRRQLEEARERLLVAEQAARTEAEAANRAKDEFLSTLSHELRTPLTPILGFVEILRRGHLSPERIAHALDTIERSARIEARLVNDLLDVSRIVSGKLQLEMERADLPALAQMAVDAVQPAAAARRLTLAAELDPAAGPVFGDPDRLRQVIDNLLTNAIKFTPTGGRVDVRLMASSGEAVIVVADTGIGIAPEMVPHVFERFHQVDGSSTRTQGGLGLGLAIVKHLVEQHGGSVTAASPGVDRGATFTVRLPLLGLSPRRADAHDQAAVAERDEEETLASVRVLVVDDDTDTRTLLRMTLEDVGASVAAAASSVEALTLVETAWPDVLLVDIGMPVEDGYQFIAKLRALELATGRATTPAIAVTAYVSAEARQRALAAGFIHHLAKPVEPETVIESVAELVAKYRTIGL